MSPTKYKWQIRLRKNGIFTLEFCYQLNNNNLLNFKKLKWDNIDIIVIPWNPAHNINSTSSRWDSDISWRGQMLSNIPSNIMKALKTSVPNSMEVKFGNTKILYLNHHDCHAASVVLVSPFQKCDYFFLKNHAKNRSFWRLQKSPKWMVFELVHWHWRNIRTPKIWNYQILLKHHLSLSLRTQFHLRNQNRPLQSL